MENEMTSKEKVAADIERIVIDLQINILEQAGIFIDEIQACITFKLIDKLLANLEMDPTIGTELVKISQQIFNLIDCEKPILKEEE